MNKPLFALAVFFLATRPAYADPPTLQGLWDGRAHTSAERTRSQLDISRSGDAWQARLNLLDIGVRSWPAESVDAEGDQLSVVVRADSGPQIMTLHFINGRLTGDW